MLKFVVKYSTQEWNMKTVILVRPTENWHWTLYVIHLLAIYSHCPWSYSMIAKNNVSLLSNYKTQTFLVCSNNIFNLSSWLSGVCDGELWMDAPLLVWPTVLINCAHRILYSRNIAAVSRAYKDWLYLCMCYIRTWFCCDAISACRCCCWCCNTFNAYTISIADVGVVLDGLSFVAKYQLSDYFIIKIWNTSIKCRLYRFIVNMWMCEWCCYIT